MIKPAMTSIGLFLLLNLAAQVPDGVEAAFKSGEAPKVARFFNQNLDGW
ncbi:MAG: hypothetical protein HC896_17295 [Bacteroidales bacterium]|nr:hypothetical protein [Bacteroidales bacterium]